MRVSCYPAWLTATFARLRAVRLMAKKPEFNTVTLLCIVTTLIVAIGVMGGMALLIYEGRLGHATIAAIAALFALKRIM